MIEGEFALAAAVASASLSANKRATCSMKQQSHQREDQRVSSSLVSLNMRHTPLSPMI